MLDDPTKPKPSLSYASPEATISRRGLRLLILLTVLNSLVLVWFVAGPRVREAVVAQWQGYQQRKAVAIAEAATAAAQARFRAARQAHVDALRACAAYRLPEGTLVYAEDSEGVARLKASGPVKELPNNNASAGLPIEWPAPTAVADPAPLAALIMDGAVRPTDAEWGIVFLHMREASAGGSKRLIIVQVDPDATWRQTTSPSEGGGLQQNFDMTMERAIYFVSADLQAVGGNLAAPPASWTRLMTDLKHGPLIVQPARPDGRVIETRVDAGEQLRLYAGVPHATDGSRFVIPYELSGGRGNIECHVDEGGNVKHKIMGPLEQVEMRGQASRNDALKIIADRAGNTRATTQPQSSH